MVKTQGTLYLVGTPIGNLEDLTLRGIRVLEEADLIACEDTRETLKLLNHLGLKKKLVSYQKFSEEAKKGQLLDLVERGKTIALISDAGMPGISDPGEILVREAYLRGIQPVVIPGPSAVIAGLVLSGLPTEPFRFQGFLPKGKESQRKAILQTIAQDQATLIFYVPPHGLIRDLETLRSVLGNRPAALARELTKFHEEVKRGTLDSLLEEVRIHPPKGEMVLILEGHQVPELSLEEDLEILKDQYARYRQLVDQEGYRGKDALTQLNQEGANKNRLYAYILEQKEKDIP